MFTFDTKMATVRPYLLLGAAQHEHDYALLRQQGVTHILQVGSELRPSFPDRFQYLRIAIDDLEQEDIIRHLKRCFNFINDARHRGNGAEDGAGVGGDSSSTAEPPSGVVLVHCMAGISRSASTVVAYLMYDEQLPYVEAFKQVKAARPCIYPNLGFLLQLWEWEAAGRDLDSWTGWGRARFAERLAEYRRAQDAAGLHRAVRVQLPMPSRDCTAAAAGGGGGGGSGGGAGAGLGAAGGAARDEEQEGVRIKSTSAREETDDGTGAAKNGDADRINANSSSRRAESCGGGSSSSGGGAGVGAGVGGVINIVARTSGPAGTGEEGGGGKMAASEDWDFDIESGLRLTCCAAAEASKAEPAGSGREAPAAAVAVLAAGSAVAGSPIAAAAVPPLEPVRC